MAPIIVSTEVARPAEQLFGYVTDPTRFVEWQEGVVSGHIEGGNPPSPGDRCLTTRRIGFAERQVTAEVTLSIRRGAGAYAASTGRCAPPST